MYDLYRVTLNGSPIAEFPAVPLQAAAYAAAVLMRQRPDLGPGMRAREYGVEFSHTVERLTMRQWRAQSAAGAIGWDEMTLYAGESNPIDLICDAYDVMVESGALANPVDVPLPVAA